MHKRSAYRDLAQVILLRRSWHRHLTQEVLIHRSCTSASNRNPRAEILHKCPYRILGDPDTDIIHKRSSYTDLAQVLLQDSVVEILNTLRKRSWYRDLAQEVLQDPDADIQTERSCTRHPHTEILHKWSYKILMQSFWHRNKRKRSAYRDLAQVVLLRRFWHRHLESCARDSHTPILHKCFYRILLRRS